MIGLMLAAALASGSPRPVVAEVTRRDKAIRVRIIAAADQMVRVRYSLTTGNTTNRATQNGAATLRPAERAVLVDVTQSGDVGWSGRLDVSVEGGGSYAIDLADPAAGSGDRRSSDRSAN